jgi:hypothetical protein
VTAAELTRIAAVKIASLPRPTFLTPFERSPAAEASLSMIPSSPGPFAWPHRVAYPMRLAQRPWRQHRGRGPNERGSFDRMPGACPVCSEGYGCVRDSSFGVKIVPLCLCRIHAEVWACPAHPLDSRRAHSVLVREERLELSRLASPEPKAANRRCGPRRSATFLGVLEVRSRRPAPPRNGVCTFGCTLTMILAASHDDLEGGASPFPRVGVVALTTAAISGIV